MKNGKPFSGRPGVPAPVLPAPAGITPGIKRPIHVKPESWPAQIVIDQPEHAGRFMAGLVVTLVMKDGATEVDLTIPWTPGLRELLEAVHKAGIEHLQATQPQPA